MADWQMLDRRRAGQLLLGGCLYGLAGGHWVPQALADGAPRHFDDGLPRGEPGAFGVDPAVVLGFLAAAQQQGIELHGLMLASNGHVIAEGWWSPYAARRVHMTHSVTKSVTSAAVGLALAEGRFTLDDRVCDFFPQQVPADASANLRAMTIRDLLTMRCGHDVATSGSKWRGITSSWIAEFFRIPVLHVPGTLFRYTSAASYMLSAIISRVTGEPMSGYLAPRLFEPMGIAGWRWDSSPGNISTGGNGLTWRTADSLKFGMLHLDGGTWRGAQLLPRDWVNAATTRQTAGDEDGDYGYQWWIMPGGAFAALGLFGQLIVGFPHHRAVLAVFAGTQSGSALERLVTAHFQTALGRDASRDGGMSVRLRRELNGLSLPELVPHPGKPPRGAGRFTAVYDMAENDQAVSRVALDVSAARCRLTLIDAEGEHSIVSGFARAVEQDTSMPGARLHHEYRSSSQRVVALARWLPDGSLELVWQFVESAFRDTVTCRFQRDGMTLDRRVNVNSAAREMPTLRGRKA